MCSRLTRIIQRRLLTVTGDAQDLRTCSPLLIRRITSFIFTMRTVLLRLYTFLTENKPRPTSFMWKKKKEKSFILYFFPLLKTITGSIKPETCTRVKELPKTCRQILVGLLVHVGCFSYILKEKYFFGKEKKKKIDAKSFESNLFIKIRSEIYLYLGFEFIIYICFNFSHYQKTNAVKTESRVQTFEYRVRDVQRGPDWMIKMSIFPPLISRSLPIKYNSFFFQSLFHSYLRLPGFNGVKWACHSNLNQKCRLFKSWLMFL